MSTHAKLSPSKRHRWAACPGSIREEAAYPDDRSGGAAVDGTHSHTLLEHCIKAGAADPTRMVGITMKDDDGTFVVDADRAARVKVAIDYIKQRHAESPSVTQVLSEKRVNPQQLLGRGDLMGTVDVQILDYMRGIVEIIDYKDGMNDAWDSAILQMEQYAVGALSEIDTGLFSTVRLTVIQPKLALKGGLAIRSVDYPIEKVLDEVARTIVLEAAATDKPDAPLVPGEKQCKYCAHKGACAALATKALQVVDRVDLTVSAAEKDPTKMTDDQIVQIMEAAPLMRQLIEGVEKEAQRRLEAGVPIGGLKLVNGKTSRSWSLSEEEMAEKLIKLGIPKGAVYETKLISPAKAKKLVRKWWNKPINDVIASLVRAKVPKKQIPQALLDNPDNLPSFTWTNRNGEVCSFSDRQVQMLMSELTVSAAELLDTMDREYVVRTTGKPVVALAADSRPAVQINAAPLFSAVSVEKPVELPAWLQ